MDEDVSGEKQSLFLTLIQCVILSDTIICYSLCLESAPHGWRTCRALQGKGNVIHHFGSVLIEFLFQFHPLAFFLHYEAMLFQRSFHLINVYVCTQQKVINQTCICTLHNVSGVWMRKCG